MKNTIKISVSLLLGMAMAVSCKEEVTPLASSVSVDKTSVTLASEDVTPQTINVTSDGDWLAVAPEWLKVEPNYGTGNTVVTLSAGDNLDEDGTLAGTRRGTVSFVVNDASAEVAVTQEGDPAKDQQRTYAKVSAVTSGKAYLMVSDLNVANPVSSGVNYGYLYVTTVTVEDEMITMDDSSNGFVFTETDGGYTLQDTYGRYMYQSGSYDNFNVSETLPSSGHIWTVEFHDDGTAKIVNVTTDKYIQYDSSYNSFGCYSGERGTMPVLYEEQPK